MALPLAAIVILLFPMGYFFLASPAFLLVKLDIPPVTQLLRGMFSVHFLMTSVAGVIGTVVFALTGRPLFAVGVALITAFAVWSRRWFLRQWDIQLSAREPATPMPCAACGGCIGAACWSNAVQLSPSCAAFPMSRPRRPDST